MDWERSCVWRWGTRRGDDIGMRDAYFSWLMIGLGWVLSLAAGGYVALRLPGQLVTRPHPLADLKSTDRWPDSVVWLVTVVMIVTGGNYLWYHGWGGWALLLMAPIFVLKALPLWIHNARITGQFRFALPYAPPPTPEPAVEKI